MDILFWITAVTGHIGIWCAAFNQIHATAWPRGLRKNSELIILATVFLPLLLLTIVAINRQDLSREQLIAGNWPVSIYVYLSAIAGLFFIVRWIWRKANDRLPANVISHDSSRINIQAEIGQNLLHGKTSKLLGRIPWNQVQQLQVESFELEFDRLPKALDGLKICQLSDLHLTGQLDKRYFEKVMSIVNRFAPDLVFFTGDLVDTAECLDWMPDVFGSVKSRHGVYYVLGNHDLRIKDEIAIRDAMHRNGHLDLGGRWETVSISNQPILFCGNELPWFPRATNMSECPSEIDGKKPFRILLSHSPDQIPWAKQHEFDLMLAGHTHGGQIRFPGIGPVFAPSRYGIKYASGTFFETPTLMHVSRGLCGCRLLRFNCRPEMTQLILRSES